MTPRQTQRKTQRPKWSMFPLMHDNVSRLLNANGLHFTFHNLDDDVSCIQTYDTSIMGRFSCHNQRCRSGGWTSMKIAITIRMYEGKQYNARVYYQRCKACNLLSKPILDDSYAERVAYRLKKWCGVELEPPEFSGQSKGPHEKDFCEGCKAGHCSEGRRIDKLVNVPRREEGVFQGVEVSWE
ncbi:hypothetical protein NA56DRAFT_669106 [Hyaloscypha hepaticicola]|uniref:3CxxC-type domain-containing protein n=1 Tax=Hyaloscypha hepaticicola TaxID=2082293 RepID=A0A2J6QEA7_9HELO|nr:hypothetical protein NA56DRAFT_669106 [Hyaloscypha hepaticicola]